MFRLALGMLALVLAIGSACSCSPTVPSTDRLPLGHWSYDAMLGLASDGLLPGMPARVFQGDRLFDRVEMAGLVASAIENADPECLTPRRILLIHHLVGEFRPEMPERAFRITGLTGVSRRAFAYGTFAHREERFFHRAERSGRALDKAAVTIDYDRARFSVGSEYRNWGPSYIGSPILSDNSPAFTGVGVSGEIDFGSIVGRVRISQFSSTFQDGGPVYFFGRRYEKELGDRWHLGVSETAKTNRFPNPLFQVVPFYWYQHIVPRDEERINCAYGADLTYYTRGGLRAYGELLVDDITAPRLFNPDFERPRKAGTLVGVSFPLSGDRLSGFRAEYARIDQRTYEATRTEFPELAYTHDGAIIGSPIGPNSTALYLRGEGRISPRLSLIAEYLNLVQKEPGPPEVERRRVLSLRASYDIAPDMSISIRAAPYRVVPPGGRAVSGTELEVRASVAL